MAEWLYEAGIGEERAILVDKAGAIEAARVDWGEPLRAGLVAEARLVAKASGARRGTVRFADGHEALIDALPPDACEGAVLTVEIVRASLAERGRTKRAHARPAPGAGPRAAPTLLEALRSAEEPVRTVRPADGSFAAVGWAELIEEASTGTIPFAGGSLTVSPTPAVTLIDVDGDLPPPALAFAAVPAIAGALRRLDIGGSIGVDFPTLPEKRDRQAVDAALADALSGWRGERTAMNGFGFVQLVARSERPSLVARLAADSEGAAARALLREAEAVPLPGALLLVAHPAVVRTLRPEWLAELGRRTAREVRIEPRDTLAIAGGFAQAVPR